MTIDDKLNMNSMQLRKVMISAHKTMLEARHEGRDTFRAVRTMNSISEIIDKLFDEDYEIEDSAEQKVKEDNG